ncbi:SAV_2336 N-terminal domain-related protein [Streptomyces sp. NBC_01618]|uniref:SAV_2336 N-terminal domain-related protein n=1 Tax=Streptomyces sp. NBC_01618 TaxID=2975900 RepID=UPI00386B42AF|nr:SAV_2336 family protein [Streptomyces sp. NBC_01618]
MFERVRNALADCGADLSSEEFLDALWLATRLPSAPAGAPAQASGTLPDDGPEEGDEGESTGPTAAGGRAPYARPASAFRRPRRGRGALRGGAAPAPEPDRTFTVPPGAPAVSVRPPGEKALGAAELALGRALRPLRMPRPDPRRRELDIPRTVAAMAETGLPDVVLRPAGRHGLDLAILVDDGVSMLPWQRLATEVRLLMERSGAFGVVHTFSLDTRSPDGPLLGHRPFGTAPATLPPTAVADPSGRTLLIVVSDGVGRAWQDGRMHHLLDRLAKVSPVAVLHTLPRRMWAGTGIRAEHWQVTTRRQAAANATWGITDPVLPPDLRPFNGTPVPVLTPTPDAVTAWTRLVGSAGTTALLPLLGPAPRRIPSDAPSAARPRTPQEPYAEVLRFRSFASTEAYRVAVHLAAVAPLPVPAMQLVRQALGASVDSGHLAEVFLSGLLHRVGDIDRPPQQWQFDFAEGTRRILLGAIPPPELLRTTRAVSSRLAELSGTAPSFLAWLPHPDGQDHIDTGQRALSWVDERVMRRLGVPLPDAPAVAPPQYDLAIRTTHSPPVPPGMAAKEVLIPWDAGAEANPKTADALRAGGLSPSDVATRILFIAPPGPAAALPVYTAMVGFTHRWVDAHADGSTLDMAGLQLFTEHIGDVARPDAHLPWAQAGGPPTDGMPTVPFAVDPAARLDETTLRTVRYAARLRMVPPDSAAAALTMLARVAALRTRGDTEWRLPVLSTGTEPPPVGKSTEGQGVDLELIRKAADRFRKEAVKGRETTEVMPVPALSPLNRRIAEANAADPAVLLRRLGVASEDGVVWTCPRDRGDHGDAVLKVTSQGQVSCKHCYPSKVGLVRLVADTLRLTPDEAAAFILNDSGDRVPAPGMAVTARVTGRTPEAYRCTVHHPVTGQVHQAVLPTQEFRESPRDQPFSRLTKGDHVVALVLEPWDGALVLSLTSPDLVERVLVGFVPELTTGDVVITRIARVAGALTKIAAAPTRPASSVRGAFVGRDAERIRGAQHLLSGGKTKEKFEVIAHSGDQRTLLVNALVYAEPTGILIDRQRAVVAVPRHQVRSAIGRGGLNAELAGRLTGLYVRIVPAGSDLRLEMDSAFGA